MSLLYLAWCWFPFALVVSFLTSPLPPPPIIFLSATHHPAPHHPQPNTLLRLPRSGGVVFTIRTYFLPITEICKEPYVPGRLASAIRSWGDDVSRYKGKDRYGDALLAYLDEKHAEQVAAGLDLEREEEERVYPF